MNYLLLEQLSSHPLKNACVCSSIPKFVIEMIDAVVAINYIGKIKVHIIASIKSPFN